MKAPKLIAKLLLPVLIVIMAVLFSRYLVATRPEVEAVPPQRNVPIVKTLTVRPQEVSFTVEAQGTVVPHAETRLMAEVSGRIEEISGSLVNGGFFEQGDLMLRIDPTDYELALEEANLAVSRAERMLVQEQADAEVARKDWESLGKGEASPLVLRQPQLAEARAELASARARLERSRRDVERTVLRAPYAGRVRSESVDLGQFIARGSEVAMIYAVDYAEVRLPLPDSELAFVDIPLAFRGTNPGFEGPDVLLRARFAGRETTWNAKIARTEGELDPMNRMVIAIARVEDPYGLSELAERPPLALGMFVEAEISGRTRADSIVLPRTALRSGERVFVVDDEERLRMRPVQVFRAERDRVVLEGGLAPGDRVIVSPLEAPVEGMQVALEGGREQ